MANNTDSNITRRVLRAFIPAMEKQRVLSKTVNTQQFAGEFTPASGDNVDIKRPHQYKAKRTTTGDISTASTNTILSGKATATVQDYITVDVDWTNKEEALSLDQLEEILKPAAEEAVTELETSFCDFMIKNAGLSYGATALPVIDAWADIAGQMALMKSLGVPGEQLYSVINPFVTQNLAGVQYGLAPGSGDLVKTAWEKAHVAANLGGMTVLTSNSLSTWTSGSVATRTGTISSAPDVTYATHKDTMAQTVTLTGLTAQTGTIKAGDMVELSDVYHIHHKTRKPIFGADGAKIKFRATVKADATVTTAGTASISITGPMLYESGGQYNTVDAAPTTASTMTILGSASTEYQPSLFYNKNAFAIATVKLPKLFSTDTVAKTEDGITLRASKYSDGDKNTQKIRIDLLPAFAQLNPFFSGKGFGL